MMNSEESSAQSTTKEPYRNGYDSYNYGCMDEIADFFTYAESYKKAGDILIEWVKTQNGLADCVVRPLCFLYLQYLELAIKGIIVDCGILLGKSEKPGTTHDIQEHWGKCKVLLTEIYGEDN